MKRKTSLIIKNNEAWILKTKGSSFYTIYDRLENLERDIHKIDKKQEVELMKLSLTRKGGKLEQSDKFWLKLYLIMQNRDKK